MPSITGGQLQPPAGLAGEGLVARALNGDPAAARRLADRHLPPVTRYAARLLGDAAEGEDVAQETFLRLWQALARWPDGDDGVSAWLFRVAHNLCIDRIRRRRTVPLDETMDPPDNRPDAGETLMQAERQRAVSAALADLPDRQRAAILLCHYEGVSNAEAASVLGVGVEAVESLLARGRRSLRKRLAEQPS